MLWAWEVVGRPSLVVAWCMRIGKGESKVSGVKESALNAWHAILLWLLSNGPTGSMKSAVIPQFAALCSSSLAVWSGGFPSCVLFFVGLSFWKLLSCCPLLHLLGFPLRCLLPCLYLPCVLSSVTSRVSSCCSLLPASEDHGLLSHLGISRWKTVIDYLFFLREMNVTSSARTLFSFGHLCTPSQDSWRWIMISFRFNLVSLVFMLKDVSHLLSFLSIIHVPGSFSRL